MLTILQYLGRSKKLQLQGVSKAFREHIVYKSLVSARFVGHDVVTQSTLLQSLVLRSRKLAKLELNEVIVDLAYVSALERAFMINQANAQTEETEESKTSQLTGGQLILSNKGVSSHGEYFRSRLTELVLNNIQFIGDNEMQRHFCIAKFFYIFNKFTSLETLTMVGV